MEFLLSCFQCGTSTIHVPLSEPDLPYYPHSNARRRQPGSPVPDLQATPSGSSKSTRESNNNKSISNVLSSRDVLDNMARESGNTNRQGIFDLDRILQSCASHDTVFTDEDDDSVVEHERVSTSCEKQQQQQQGAIRQSPGVSVSTSPTGSCNKTTSPQGHNNNNKQTDYHVRIRMSPPREGHALRPLKYHSYDGEDADLVLRRTVSESRSELPLPVVAAQTTSSITGQVARE